MYQFFKLILVLNLYLRKDIKLADGHTCNYQIPQIDELVNNIKIEELPPNVRQKRETSPNLRIHYEYQPSFLNSQSDYIIKNILEPARLRLQKLIIPKSPINGVLRVDRPCNGSNYRKSVDGIAGCTNGCVQATCLNFTVPEKFLKPCTMVNESGSLITSGPEGGGITNVDLVLLIVQSPCKGNLIAFAASCFFEDVLDRPILGVVNLCPGKFEPNKKVKENIMIVMHEMIHALGVVVDKYALYRYDNGTPIVPRNEFGIPALGLHKSGLFYMWNDKIIKPIIRKRESAFVNFTVPFYGLVLPKVLEAVRSHFNCPSLAAVDLEDYGDISSTFSHFDEYLLLNEIMTPQTNGAMDTLSNITLALLEDTGWYKADYSQSSKLDYGYHKGCELSEKGCYRYMQDKKERSEKLDPFCNTPRIYGKSLSCSIFKNYYQFCGLVKYKAVNEKFQYFTDLSGINNNETMYYTGLSPYNEYCPVPMMLSNPNFMCDDEYNNNTLNPYNIMPSYYGPDSMCFLNDIYTPYPQTFYGASCQKYSLSKNDLTIIIGSQSFNCSPNAIHNVSLSDGKVVAIICPDDTQTNLAMKQIYSKIIISSILLILWILCLPI